MFEKLGLLRVWGLILFSACAALVNVSCTEKIDLELKKSEPQIAIEGRITDGAYPTYVLISKSMLYNQSNAFNGVEDAVVIISDDAGNTDTLTMFEKGIFFSPDIQGVIGRTYFLKAFVEGQLYESFSTMQQAVEIDTIVFDNSFGFGNNPSVTPLCFFRDPAGFTNYYKVESYINSKKQNSDNVSSDRLWDGKFRSLFIPNDTLISGDTLQVDLLMLDKRVYDYFDALEDIGGGFNQPAAPANPPTNITPPTLGYFSAHPVRSKTVIVP